MSRVLVVDDMKTFSTTDYEHQVDPPPPSEFVYARTLQDGQDYIDKMWAGDEWFDELWLDHDLGPNDIRPLVMGLVEAAVVGGEVLPSVSRVCCISFNPVGAEWIRRQLSDYYAVAW